MAFYLYNAGFSRQYLALDPASRDPARPGLRAATALDDPLPFRRVDDTQSAMVFATTVSRAELCLSVDTLSRVVVHLAPCMNTLNQRWAWTTVVGGAKLSNHYLGVGTNWFLDVYSDTYQAHMSFGSYTGQLWTWIEAGAVIPAADVSTSARATLPTTARSTVSDTPSTLVTSFLSEDPSTPTSSSDLEEATEVPSPAGLNIGAKAGIGVGVGLGAIGLAALVVFLLFLRKRRNQPVPPESSVPVVMHNPEQSIHAQRSVQRTYAPKTTEQSVSAELSLPVAELDGRTR